MIRPGALIRKALARPLPAWLGARLRRRRFGPALAASHPGDIPRCGLDTFFEGLELPEAPPPPKREDVLVVAARRELAALKAAELGRLADQVEQLRRRAWTGWLGLGGSVHAPDPVSRHRRRGPFHRLIRLIF